MKWMVAEGYAESDKLPLRDIALQEIVQISNKTRKFDAFISYAAMNMFDRFVSRHEVPKILEGFRDNLVLAAHSYLAVSWFLRGESFSYTEFLEEDTREYTDSFERRQRKGQIMQMGIEICRGLYREVKVITPIFFVRVYVGGIIQIGKHIKPRTLYEIAVQTQGDGRVCNAQVHGCFVTDIRFTRFLPAVIAASALTVACSVLFGAQFYIERLTWLVTRYVDKEELITCMEETYELCFEKKIVFERDVGLTEEDIERTRKRLSLISIGDDEEPEPEPKPQIDPHMDFELKWMKETTSTDLEEWPIRSPGSRNQD